MSVLPIYTYGALVLRKKAKPVAAVDDTIIQLAVDMVDTMHHANGIGLAATQVGKMHRVIVIDISDVEEPDDTPENEKVPDQLKRLTLINPQVLDQEGSWSMEEGCLSIPDVRDEVERAMNILVRFKDSEFRDVELKVCGLLGRVILHEIDHLNGVLFLDHLPATKRKSHSKMLKQIQRGEFEVNYPVVTAATVAV